MGMWPPSPIYSLDFSKSLSEVTLLGNDIHEAFVGRRGGMDDGGDGLTFKILSKGSTERT